MDLPSTNLDLSESLLDHAACGFLIFNDEGRITMVNATVATMLSYKKEELIGKKFDSSLTIAGKIFYQTHFFPLIRLHEKAEEIFLTLIAADGREIPVLLNARRIVRNGEYENQCVLFSVPQRKKYEAELIEAKKLLEHILNRNELLQQTTAELEHHKVELDKQVTRLFNINRDLVQFSNAISHDIQERIRKIAMFADIINREDQPKLSDLSKTSLDKIKNASTRMRSLISCLQQYVSVDTAEINMAVCNLDDILARAKLKSMIDTRFQGINLSITTLPEVQGNCEQLELMFYHLMLNAIQFRADENKSVIRVEAEIIQQNSFRTIQGKYRYIDFVRIHFKDEGVGFDNRYNNYVFELFKKAHPDTNGLGFGLALCKKIAENHYGSIEASSKVNMGTSFTILLPLKQEEAA